MTRALEQTWVHIDPTNWDHFDVTLDCTACYLPQYTPNGDKFGSPMQLIEKQKSLETGHSSASWWCMKHTTNVTILSQPRIVFSWGRLGASKWSATSNLPIQVLAAYCILDICGGALSKMGCSARHHGTDSLFSLARVLLQAGRACAYFRKLCLEEI